MFKLRRLLRVGNDEPAAAEREQTETAGRTGRQAGRPARRKYFISQSNPEKSAEIINYCWDKIFRDDSNLKQIAGDNPVYNHTDDNSFIYLIKVAGKVKYIGSTHSKYLKARWTNVFDNGQAGYNVYMKCRILNAFHDKTLSVSTRLCPSDKVKQVEKKLIEKYSRKYELWNRRDNPRFSPVAT